MRVEPALLPQLGAKMLTLRSWKAGLIIGLTILLIVPLYHLRDYTDAVEYKDYIYEQFGRYLSREGGVYNNTLYQEGKDLVHQQFNFSEPCKDFPDTNGILLVMKTGGTEAFDKVPTQLLTTMQCLPDFLLFSDLEQQIGRYHIYNVLDRVNETVKEAHDEFRLYDAQQQCPVSQKDCTTGMKGAWDLDKYKFLNMVERTWAMRPDMEWYVFAEADTYVVWSNLVHWLRERANPEENPYVGSVALIKGIPFAHGGSGYVVSGAFMRKMIELIPDVAAKYDEQAGKECCGDLLISLALAEVGAKVKQAHPMFNGEKPNTLPYGPGHWCEPIFTMHHMNSEEVSAVWQYEQTRTKNEIMQIKDLYYQFFAQHLIPFRREWSNLAEDTCYIAPGEEAQKDAGPREKARQKKEEEKNVIEKLAHTSPFACSLVCEAAGLDISEEEYKAIEKDVDRRDFIRNKLATEKASDVKFKQDRRCFQWKFQRNMCCTGKSFKLGAPKREVEEKNKFTSGWFVQGIQDWIEARGECDGVAWREPR